MANAVKQLRSQLRQLVKEVLPELFKVEVLDAIRKQVDARLKAIDAHVNKSLEEMNERTKETQSYVVRNLALAQVRQVTPSLDTSADNK